MSAAIDVQSLQAACLAGAAKAVDAEWEMFRRESPSSAADRRVERMFRLAYGRGWKHAAVHVLRDVVAANEDYAAFLAGADQAAASDWVLLRRRDPLAGADRDMERLFKLAFTLAWKHGATSVLTDFVSAAKAIVGEARAEATG